MKAKKVNPGDAPKQKPAPKAIDAKQDVEISSIEKRLAAVEAILGIKK